MNKKLFLLPLLMFCLASIAQAKDPGAEARTDVTPASMNNGNQWRGISVALSTSQAVLISSKAANSGLPVQNWRVRVIVNSSNGVLKIVPNGNGANSIFTSTESIVLSSGTVTTGVGGSWTTYNQGEIWGIWSGAATTGGASGEEEWWQ